MTPPPPPAPAPAIAIAWATLLAANWLWDDVWRAVRFYLAPLIWLWRVTHQ